MQGNARRGLKRADVQVFLGHGPQNSLLLNDSRPPHPRDGATAICAARICGGIGPADSRQSLSGMSDSPKTRSGAGETIAAITPKLFRRLMAATLFGLLGGLLIWLGLGDQTEGVLWKAFSIAMGIGTLIVGQWLWRATSVSIELTRRELRDSAGRVLCDLEKVASVDRGAFAFKPSNGLVVRLSEPAPLAWAPGIWWRCGHRIGIGGVTSPSEAKGMADVMSLLLKERRDDSR